MIIDWRTGKHPPAAVIDSCGRELPDAFKIDTETGDYWIHARDHLGKFILEGYSEIKVWHGRRPSPLKVLWDTKWFAGPLR